MMNTLVIGSINIDLMYNVPYIVEPGETIHSTEQTVSFGGKGANQAIIMSQLGAHVNFVGCVGQDDYGKRALQNLRNYDVATEYVEQAGVTGNALIQVSETGENAIVLMNGANYSINPEMVRNSSHLINSSDVLLLQLEIPLEAVAAALEVAMENGTPVILNPAPAQKLPSSLLSKVDILTPNETELAILTQKEINTDQEIEEASAVLLDMGVKVVVVTLGEKGAYFTDGTEQGWVPAQKVKAVDTTGAGDAFNGALAIALSKKYSMRKAIEFAALISSYVVTQRGAQIKIPADLHALD